MTRQRHFGGGASNHNQRFLIGLQIHQTNCQIVLGIKDRCCVVTHIGSIQRLAVKTCGLLQPALIKGQPPCPIKPLKICIRGRALLLRW